MCNLITNLRGIYLLYYINNKNKDYYYNNKKIMHKNGR